MILPHFCSIITILIKILSGIYLCVKNINQEMVSAAGAVPLARVGQCHPHLGGSARPTSIAGGAIPGDF